MFGNITVGKRLVLGFGAAALTLLAIAFASYLSITKSIENDSMVRHTYEVRDKIQDVVTGLLSGETGVRGFVITGDDSYLEPYNAALSDVPAAIDSLRKLTVDNPHQGQRWDTLAPLLDTKWDQLRQRVDARRTEGFDGAQKLVLTNTSKATMNRIRSILKDADDEEANLLSRRLEASTSSAHFTLSFMMWGGLFGTLIVATIGWLIARSLAAQIGTAVGQVNGSSTELQAAANQQASGAKEQAAAMTEISTTISELLATSRQIAESAQRVARNSEQTANAARSGHSTVDLTHDSISGIKRQVDQIVSHMLDLGRKSQEIGSVLDIVSELAEQTNILAINATIEAAGAGESGKRFAVVAEEIRKLADRVGDSTKEVRTLIEDVRSAVNTTVMATETGSKAVDAGTRQFGDVATAFKQIATLVTTTTDAAREIELSTKQQSTAVEQVNVAIANVTQASVETETSAGQTLQTVSQMATLAKDLLKIIQPKRAA
ncbi:MAG: methyl-accepting chemotaxis protein [Alphaproteobacteria bacterium]